MNCYFSCFVFLFLAGDSQRLRSNTPMTHVTRIETLPSLASVIWDVKITMHSQISETFTTALSQGDFLIRSMY